MGKVRSSLVKRLANQFINYYPDKFGTNYEENKKLVSSLSPIDSKKLRNGVAGYITSLVKHKIAMANAPPPLDYDEYEEDEQ